MNRLFICGLALLFTFGCNNTKVTLKGRLIGAESSAIYLERVDNAQNIVIDSAMLNKEGRFTISFAPTSSDPSLYNIVCGGERVPLLLTLGESVEISSMGRISNSYKIEGSQESELLRKFYQPYIKGISTLDAFANDYASTDLNDTEKRDLAHKYAKEYQRIKQEQLRFIIENQSQMAAIYALYQRLPGDEYLFNGDNDIIYFRTVSDALEQSYPNSSYLKSLRKSISQMEARMNIKSKISSSNHPELELPDVFGNNIKLSNYDGKVILLVFWSPELGNSNVQNAELKGLYAKYRDQGFEIYQVGVDSSKSRWISTVQEQRLPWVSVNDLKGGASPVLGTYNVTKLPTNFLIDRNGTVTERDVKLSELEDKIKAIL